MQQAAAAAAAKVARKASPSIEPLKAVPYTTNDLTHA